ncbi:hypothetical protein CAPTEDRAFT_49152, partial [Capitella teleta]
PDMKEEVNRQLTFNNWLHHFPVKASALAKAGFFFIGPGDRVECAFCGGRVSKWVPGDSALGKHQHLFPTCLIVENLSMKGQ